MKIVRILVRTARVTYDRPFSNPHHAWDAKRAVFAFVELDNGALGVGEAWCDSGSVGSVVTLIEDDLAPRVVGQRCSPEAAWEAMHRLEVMSVKGGALAAAISAVDIALWDAYARALGQPLHRLLGGARTEISAYGSSGLYAPGYGPDALADDMKRAVESGFCGVKIKVAGAPLAVDVDRVRAVRDAIGPEPRLMVDALFANTVPQAVRLGMALKPFDLWFYEAPTSRHDVAGWADIRRATGLPLSGPEVESGLDPFRRMLEMGAVDYLQADATICGGITATRRIADLAKAYHRPLTLHASGSVVAFAANACAGAAWAAGESVEFHLLHQFLFDRLWDAGYRIERGVVVMSERPGLGIDMHPDDPAFDR